MASTLIGLTGQPVHVLVVLDSRLELENVPIPHLRMEVGIAQD